MAAKQKITTYLWFDDNAEEAMNLYVSIFKNSKVLDVRRPPGGDSSAKPLLCSFQLEGQRFIALNGGPQFKFTEAISLLVSCDSQDEVDELWEKLISGGGAPSRCGWLKDRFGLSWQIIPETLMQLMSDRDPVKAKRVMDAMLKMSKIDVKALQAACAG
jgi:predicted 3-demethylubiquinone-9 3-methyltransferase (glyoxalase superfamily)